MNNKPCYMCINARVVPELTDETDLSYHPVGDCDNGFRIMIGSGNRRPMRILFEQWNGEYWRSVGVYDPKFCPNCGRELSEYRRNNDAVD